MNPIRPHEKIIKSRGGLPASFVDNDDIVIPDTIGTQVILRRAHVQRQTQTKPKDGRIDGEGVYQPMATEDGFSAMGFYIVRDNGDVDLFSYASLGDVELKQGEHGEYLSFVHRTKAVTLTGSNLFPIIDALNRHTVSTLYEYGKSDDGQPLPYRKSQPLITDVLITDVMEGRNNQARH